MLRGLNEIKSSAEKAVEIAERALKNKPDQKARDKILSSLDKISYIIEHSEVKEVAGFLFPPAETTDAASASDDAFCVYIKSILRFNRSLAEAVGFNLDEISNEDINPQTNTNVR